MSSLSNKLYELRKSRHISLQTLSLQTGISMASLSAYERGKYAPSLDSLCKLATFYSTSLDDLIENPLNFTIPRRHHTK